VFRFPQPSQLGSTSNLGYHTASVDVPSSESELGNICVNLRPSAVGCFSSRLNDSTLHRFNGTPDSLTNHSPADLRLLRPFAANDSCAIVYIRGWIFLSRFNASTLHRFNDVFRHFSVRKFFCLNPALFNSSTL
jgi:hypothetical protein